MVFSDSRLPVTFVSQGSPCLNSLSAQWSFRTRITSNPRWKRPASLNSLSAQWSFRTHRIDAHRGHRGCSRLNSLSAQWSFRTFRAGLGRSQAERQVSIAFRLNGLFGHPPRRPVLRRHARVSIAFRLNGLFGLLQLPSSPRGRRCVSIAFRLNGLFGQSTPSPTSNSSASLCLNSLSAQWSFRTRPA